MIHKLSDALLEALYASLIVFVYCYLFTTFVEITPLRFGFHPVLNGEEIAVMLMSILGFFTSLKLVIAVYRLIFKTETDKKMNYIASNRKFV